MRNKQRGVTLLEALVAFGLLVGALTFIGAMARSGQQQSALNQAVNLLAAAETSVRQHYSLRDSYFGLSTTQAVLIGAIPPAIARETIPGAWSATHSFGGAFHVGVNNWDGQAAIPDAGFFIQFNALPREACISLVMQAGGNYRGVAIGTGVGAGPTLSGLTRRVTAEGTVLNPATVATWCAAAANTVRFETL